MKDLTTEQLKEELTRRGYYTGNLWHIDDVKGRFEATNDQAQDVLNEVLQGSWIIEQIFEYVARTAFSVMGLIFFLVITPLLIIVLFKIVKRLNK